MFLYIYPSHYMNETNTKKGWYSEHKSNCLNDYFILEVQELQVTVFGGLCYHNRISYMSIFTYFHFYEQIFIVF
jgi:hypothetical protein